eukprot:UN00896
MSPTVGINELSNRLRAEVIFELKGYNCISVRIYLLITKLNGSIETMIPTAPSLHCHAL